MTPSRPRLTSRHDVRVLIDHLATGGQPEDRSSARWNAEPTTVIDVHAAEFVLAEFPESASKAAL